MRAHHLPAALFAALACTIAPAAHAESLTWAQVKERAVQHSPAVIKGRQAVRATRAETEGLGRWPRTNPVLSGSFETGAPFGNGDDRNYTVAFEQELDVVGVASTGANLARHKVTSAERESDVSRLDGLAEAAEAFFELDRAERALGVWIELEKSFQLIATAATRAAGAGERPDLDATLAEADSAGAATDLAQARIELSRAQARLSLLVAATDPSALHATTDDADAAPDPRPVSELVAIAERRRPEIGLWQARRAEAEARRTFAVRSALPQPTLGLGVRGERFQEGRASLLGNPGGLTGFRHQGTIMEFRLSIPLPFFDTNQAERARASADAVTASEQAEIASREVKAGVLRSKAAALETWTALQRWRSLGARLVEAQALLQKGYAAGQVSLFDSLAGAERIARARVRAVDARTAYLKARAELARAIGEDP